MSRYLILFYLLINSINVSAQTNYNAQLIPKDILAYASAVVRNSEYITEVKDLNTTAYRVKVAVTVLNKNGDDAAQVQIWHNKISTIMYVKGLIYNEYGEPIGKITEKQFTDVNNMADYSLFEDSKVKYFVPAVNSYPYTIEYEYEIRSKSSMTIYSWYPVPQPGVAVEQSKYVLLCKPDFKIRYKAYNLSSQCVTDINKDGLKTYTWLVADIKAVRNEPLSPDHSKFLPRVSFATEQFSYDGINGAYTNWNELGKWINDKLLAGRDKLEPATVNLVKDMTSNITDPKLKAKKIYEYMQRNTRYVSIQIGIGGQQPATANEVDRLKYGDCKGLVNYTQALLRAVGVESYYCVVEAGNRKLSLDLEFASISQGNHIILCLPFKNDTTFLECTNQKIAFGFLGDFTDDRLVLACTPEGGKLMRTTKYPPEVNLQIRKAVLTLDSSGSVTGTMTTRYKGTQYNNIDDILNEKGAEREKRLKEHYSINNFEVKSLRFDQDKNEVPSTTEEVNFDARDFASTAYEEKLSFMPNIVNRLSKPIREVRNRINPVEIANGYTDEDEITYAIPSGYKMAIEPLFVIIEKPFGKYRATLTVKDNKLVYKRYIQMIDGMYSKDIYPQLVTFYQSVYDNDHYRVTLSNK